MMRSRHLSENFLKSKIKISKSTRRWIINLSNTHISNDLFFLQAENEMSIDELMAKYGNLPEAPMDVDEDSDGGKIISNCLESVVKNCLLN